LDFGCFAEGCLCKGFEDILEVKLLGWKPALLLPVIMELELNVPPMLGELGTVGFDFNFLTSDQS
jgi:hypothetical protein